MRFYERPKFIRVTAVFQREFDLDGNGRKLWEPGDVPEDVIRHLGDQGYLDTIPLEGEFVYEDGFVGLRVPEERDLATNQQPSRGSRD